MKNKTPIQAILDKTDFKPTGYIPPENSTLPYVTHIGELKLGEITIEVCMLSNGQRIIEEKELKKLFGD